MHQRIAHDKAIARFEPLVHADSRRNSVPDKTAKGAKGHPNLRANAALKLTLLLFFALVLSFAAVSLAQTGDVTVQFNGGGDDNKVFIGEENRLQIFIENPGGALVGMSLGFGFTSAVPGFSWKTPYGNKPLPPRPSTYVQEYADAIDKLGNNGLNFGTWLLPDAFLMGGAAASSSQDLPVHAASTMLYDLVLIMPADPGEYVDGFCIDNIYIPPAGAWAFEQGGSVGGYPPTFQGNENTSPSDPDAPSVCFDIVHRGVDIGLFGWPRRVGSGEPVFFTGINTVSVDSWDWDFGDLTTHGTVQNPIHSYSSTGVYTVTLVATLTGGGTQTVTRTNYIVVNPVTADFTASPRCGSLDLNPGGLLVQFTDASTNAPTSWLWDFGDPASGGDNTSTLPSPTHTYASSGYYTVKLTASNPASSDTKVYLNCIRVDAVATPDLQVSCYGPERVRRGFHKELDVVVANVGSADAAGTTLTLDLSLLPTGVTFAGSVLPPNESGPPFPATVTWNLPTITWDPTPLDFDDYRVKADLYVAPGVSVGTDVQTIASTSQAPGEVVLTNNIFTEHEKVVASIDPNDKSVQPRGCGSQRAIKGTEGLDYLIQFENKPSATADAYYVLVMDTLDPNLDWGTLELGPSSKDNVLTFDFDPTSGEMVWFFDGYNLLPNHNPPEGEGFVSYSISPKPGLSEGALIKNLA
ncbi:MAG: PKD domain-containing protein, partial [candidate division Zixibacteria bacterium]|nr:PKD domain-containing protein [candidate division Zixibacteria bacterium]